MYRLERLSKSFAVLRWLRAAAEGSRNAHHSNTMPALTESLGLALTQCTFGTSFGHPLKKNGRTAAQSDPPEVFFKDQGEAAPNSTRPALLP